MMPAGFGAMAHNAAGMSGAQAQGVHSVTHSRLNGHAGDFEEMDTTAARSLSNHLSHDLHLDLDLEDHDPILFSPPATAVTSRPQSAATSANTTPVNRSPQSRSPVPCNGIGPGGGGGGGNKNNRASPLFNLKQCVKNSNPPPWLNLSEGESNEGAKIPSRPMDIPKGRNGFKPANDGQGSWRGGRGKKGRNGRKN